MNQKGLFSIGLGALLGTFSAQAQDSLVALATFGNNGWLAPGNSGLVTGSTDRGLAFADGELYYASSSAIVEIDPNAGTDLGNLSVVGVSGGTFAVDSLAAGSDGTLYAGNLTTSATSPFKIYSYANPTSLGTAPTVAYSGNPLSGTTRLGDTLAAIGSGASTVLVAGSGGGTSGYEAINQGSATYVAFSGGTPPTSGFSKAITLAGPGQVIGTGTSGLFYNTTYSGGTGTLVGGASVSIPDPNGNTADRILSYNVLDGQALLAVQSIGDSHVSLYNVSTPNSPVFIAELDNTVSPGANANGTGQLAWGAVTDNADGSVSETLYALGSGQGIQAFVVTVGEVPEPSTISMVVIGAGCVMFRLRRQVSAV
jgi:hypothetical protein